MGGGLLRRPRPLAAPREESRAVAAATVARVVVVEAPGLGVGGGRGGHDGVAHLLLLRLRGRRARRVLHQRGRRRLLGEGKAILSEVLLKESKTTYLIRSSQVPEVALRRACGGWTTGGGELVSAEKSQFLRTNSL